jgi:hypothetical protein
MSQHDFEITIAKNGEVKVHVKGAKGKACLDYVKWLSEVVGKVKSQSLTSEYYEPDGKSHIDQHLKLRDKK